MDTVLLRITELIRELLPEYEGEIALSARFQEDLGMDSLNMVDLLSDAETAFDLEIPDSRLDNLDRVEGLVEYIVSVLREESDGADVRSA
ncbi:acyl carrier protein [Lentzea xinjiangensis]|uniref:Acyl carrier protein n=1 Tax=Lentzea xinjiangensis TaxID=402600 RepID=A0A1H9SZM7_9PSEU|nr:acyl carrier protein [Lentzea xinjiangensis]SER89823.1 acyl carrier protein [Lentzea xinjiangensis]